MNSPLRKKRKQTIIKHPITGEIQMVESTEKTSAFDDGSLDTNEIKTLTPLKCGCITDAGGACAVCNSVVCSQHLHRCEKCHKPLCGEHAYDLELKNHGKVSMCKRCYKKTKRKNRNRKILQFAFSPLVDMEGRS